MEWLTYVVGAISLLGGGTGIAAIYKARQDAKQGIRQGEIDEDVAISEQWRNIIETQAKSIVDPLVAQVARLQGEVSVLQKEVKELKAEKDTLINRADSYEVYIGTLIHHIDSGKGPPAPSRPEHLVPLRR